jgi:hypothetical protein
VLFRIADRNGLEEVPYRLERTNLRFAHGTEADRREAMSLMYTAAERGDVPLDTSEPEVPASSMNWWATLWCGCAARR